MSLTSEKITSVDSYVRKKVEIFQATHEELEIQEKDIEILISSLINGQIKDLGGLIALRGFVYQYYVTMNYMIDMLHPSGAWWNAVGFELLDDIVLLGDTGIRFVQVKTGREDGRHKIKSGDLYTRKRDLNSWLDKLFLNISYYERCQEETGYTLNIDENYKVEFEIATNYPIEHDHYLEPYFMNSDFNLPGDKKHSKDDLLERLQKPQDLYEKKGTRHTKVDTVFLANKLTPFTIQWCLQRLYINSLGYFPHLEKTLKYKIQDILNENDSALSVALSESILQNLLATLVSRTHDDSPYLDKKELIFTKDELKGLFDQWKKEGQTRIYEALKQNFLMGKFTSCIEELKDSIKQHWSGEKQKEILDRLDWIYLQLMEWFKHEGDIDAYEKFLNRLFEMKNHTVPISLDQTGERQYLINSLKYMSICLSFYTEHRFPYKDSSLLFKQGLYNKEDSKTFATFNAREQIELDVVKRQIVQTIKKCAETQKIQEDYYCLIIDSKETIEDETDPFASLVDISTVTSTKRITEVPPNVHFINPKDIQKIIGSLQKHPGLNFQDQQVRDIWNTTIERKKDGDGIR